MIVAAAEEVPAVVVPVVAMTLLVEQQCVIFSFDNSIWFL